MSKKYNFIHINADGEICLREIITDVNHRHRPYTIFSKVLEKCDVNNHQNIVFCYFLEGYMHKITDFNFYVGNRTILNDPEVVKIKKDGKDETITYTHSNYVRQLSSQDIKNDILNDQYKIICKAIEKNK